PSPSRSTPCPRKDGPPERRLPLCRPYLRETGGDGNPSWQNNDKNEDLNAKPADGIEPIRRLLLRSCSAGAGALTPRKRPSRPSSWERPSSSAWPRRPQTARSLGPCAGRRG